jgi:hypothetical protein
VRKRVITLDKQTKKRIVELLAVRESLLANRREHLSSLAILFYGLALGVGFVLLMSIVKTGEFWIALALAPFVVFFLHTAFELEIKKQKDIVKIKLR